MATIRIELEIQARPFTREEMEAANEGCGFEDELNEPDDLDPWGIGECLAGLFFEGSETTEEMFAGSGIYAKLGDAKLIRAEEVAEPPK